jgi:hypothetical protein
MTARVEHYDGKLRIRTGTHGTRVHIVLPARTAANPPVGSHD